MTQEQLPLIGTIETEATVESILKAADIVRDVVGKDWLDRGLERRATRPKPKDPSSFAFIYGPPDHALVEWFSELDRWRDDCRQTGKMALVESVLRLTALGTALESAQASRGFTRLISRLRDIDHFESAAFEAEVAAYYRHAGCYVEFIDEGKEKSPDLKATKDGITAWVECKRRDGLSELDRETASIWKEVESSVLRYLTQQRLSYVVFLKARDGLRRSDVQYLQKLLCRAVDARGVGLRDLHGDRPRAIVDASGRFVVMVEELALAGQPLQGTLEFGAPEKPDRWVLGGDVNAADQANVEWRNPVVVAFKNGVQADRVSGIVGSVKSAAKQLPSTGPSIVWLRVADGAWSHDLEGALKQANEVLRSQLRNGQNRRVNSVFLWTQCFSRPEKEGMVGLSYDPVLLRVDHPDPATWIDIDAFHGIRVKAPDS